MILFSLDLDLCTKKAFIAKYINIKDMERRQRDEISTAIFPTAIFLNLNFFWTVVNSAANPYCTKVLNAGFSNRPL